MFPGVGYEDLLVVPTCQARQRERERVETCLTDLRVSTRPDSQPTHTQHASVDLVNVGAAVEAEKDALLERFTAFAARVCALLQAQGHWADYIDPCSGLPMVHRQGTGVYGEVDALVTLLHYTTANAGCCKVLLHPRWGSAVYPASLLTKAPLETAHSALRAVAAEMATQLRKQAAAA